MKPILKSAILLFLLCHVCIGLAQDSTLVFNKIKTIETKCSYFTTDNLGNIYSVQKDRITKYSVTGDSLYSQSFKWMGEITSVDATNALRILVFSRDLNRLMILDNTLSVQGEVIKLENLGMQFTSLVCQSPNNSNLWVYNMGEFRLLRLNKDFSVANNSGNLTQVLGISINPDFILEADNHLYLNDPELGILVFDMFGGYVKTLPLKGLHSFQIIGNSVFYLAADKLITFEVTGLAESSFDLPLTEIQNFRIEKDKLYLHTASGISIFSIEKN